MSPARDPSPFSQEEAQRIFARAARRQHAAPAHDGLTVEDLVAIGREAGLDPDLVAAEAAGERLGDGPAGTWHGVPVGIRRARLLPSRVSDREWERVVDGLRAEFGVSGVSEQIGTRREWRSIASTSSSMASAYRVTVEARPDGDLVTVEAPDTARQMGRLIVASLVTAGAAAGVLVGLIEGDWGATASMIGGLGALGLGAYLMAWTSARVTAVRTPLRFEALLDRVDLLSRTEDAGPRLDLDALPDAPAVETRAGRDRLRS